MDALVRMRKALAPGGHLVIAARTAGAAAPVSPTYAATGNHANAQPSASEPPSTSPRRSSGACSSSAAAPATCGEDIEVPLSTRVPVLSLCEADVIDEPGPKMSTQVPKLENDERASLLVVEPTVKAPGVRAGDCRQAS